MKNVTDIFKKAIDAMDSYNIEYVQGIFDSHNFYLDILDDEWCDYLWYVIGTAEEFCFPQTSDDIYGYSSVQFPVAFIFDNCPETVKSLLSEKTINPAFCNFFDLPASPPIISDVPIDKSKITTPKTIIAICTSIVIHSFIAKPNDSASFAYI